MLNLSHPLVGYIEVHMKVPVKNPMKVSLDRGPFHKRVVPSKKTYSRKAQKNRDLRGDRT